VKLGTENRKQLIAAGILGGLLLLVAAYEVTTFSSTDASTATTAASVPAPTATNSARPTRRGSGSAPGKKEHAPQSLDPTLHLDQLALTEQIKYEGSGRNIFVAQADAVIPTPGGTGATDRDAKNIPFPIPAVAPPPPWSVESSLSWVSGAPPLCQSRARQADSVARGAPAWPLPPPPAATQVATHPTRTSHFVVPDVELCRYRRRIATFPELPIPLARRIPTLLNIDRSAGWRLFRSVSPRTSCVVPGT